MGEISIDDIGPWKLSGGAVVEPVVLLDLDRLGREPKGGSHLWLLRSLGWHLVKTPPEKMFWAIFGGPQNWRWMEVGWFR